MKRFTSLCVVVAGVWVSACGGSSPTTPTAAAAPAITPATGVLLIDQTQGYSVANGTPDAIVTWTSSDPRVLTIDDAGNATAIATGIATITASFGNGQTAALLVLVVPNYQGTWTGNTTNTACTDIAGFASINYCSQGLRTTRPLTLSLTQTGLTIVGTMTKSEAGGQVSGTVAGGVGSGGDITLTGTLTGLSSGANLVVTLLSWNSLATGPNMTGIGAANVTSQQILGIATVQWSFTGVTLTTASLSPGAGLRTVTSNSNQKKSQ